MKREAKRYIQKFLWLPKKLPTLDYSRTEWKWLEKGLADLLINDLSQHPQLQLVSREQMQLAILRMQHDTGPVPEWQEVIAKQLKAFRDGGRSDPMMTPMAKPLSDADIDNLAAYYAGLE